EDSSTNTATGNVLANDTGGVAALSVAAVDGILANVGTDVAGQFGTFHINSDGSFTYTLDNTNATVNALNTGDTLSDSLGYTASDGTTQSIATLQITIQGNTDTTPVNAANDSADVTEDATPNTATGNVLTNDTGGVATLAVAAVSGNAASV